MNPTVAEALKKYNALLALEQSTHSRTTRARNEVIRALNDSELIEFAVALKGDENEPAQK